MFFIYTANRYHHRSVSEGKKPSTSPDSLNQDRERGRPKLQTKTLDGPALEDVDTSMQHDEASSPRRHWG